MKKITILVYKSSNDKDFKTALQYYFILYKKT
jgi:hypothetical protein